MEGVVKQKGAKLKIKSKLGRFYDNCELEKEGHL